MGRMGENRVASYLRGRLANGQFVILSDLILPIGEGTTQIDHIVLGRSGIFVIETKNMSGWIFGTEDQAQWTQVVFRRKSRFQNPLRQNHLHIKAVQDLLKLPQSRLYNLVVFAGSATPKTPMPDNVLFGERALGDRILSYPPPVFTLEEIAAFAETLTRQSLERNSSTRAAHVAHVREKIATRNADRAQCPVCGAPMKRRTQRQTGQPFLGCSRYPSCKGTRPFSQVAGKGPEDTFDVLE